MTGKRAGQMTKRLEEYVRSQFETAEAERVIATLTSLELPMRERQNTERVLAAIVVLAHGDGKRFEDALKLAEETGGTCS